MSKKKTWWLKPGENDLLSQRPDLAEEWDYDKNGNLRPEDVTVHSGKKRWWRCKKDGMSWGASASNRAKGHGCPYCAGRLPIPGETDLATLRPDLAEEWDYEKNGELRPEDVTVHSGKKRWWKCPKCWMSWGASVSTRAKGHGCPYCVGRLPIPGETDLTTLRPDLAEEWDYEKNRELRPEEVTLHSRKKVWWKCPKCWMSWEATVANRANGKGCPYDAGKLPILGQTDITTLRPDLTEEWDYEKNGDLRPEDVTLHSNKKVWWKCKTDGISWKTAVSNRVNGTGCPYCAGKRPIPGKTDLATLRPDLTEEWDYEKNGDLRPEDVTLHSNKKVWWKCKTDGMSWAATVFHRTKGTRCPYCAGKIPIPGKTDLATLRPDLAEEWDYEKNEELRPDNVSLHSNKEVWWLCKIDEMSWKTTVSSRASGSGCPYCAGKIPIPGKTDLATLRPDLAEEWDYEKNRDLRPEEVTVHSGKKRWWRCRKDGMSWAATVDHRVNGDSCPYCAGKIPIPGKTDLATLRPALIAEWNCEGNGMLRPENITLHSARRVSWKCSRCGEIWKANVYDRAKGSGCPHCYKAYHERKGRQI